LLQAEWLNQQERKLKARIKRANFPEIWTLESFPFKHQPGVSRRQIQELAELEFIPKATNLIFIGPTAVGKTGLASGLLLKALQNGYRGLFIRAAPEPGAMPLFGSGALVLAGSMRRRTSKQ